MTTATLREPEVARRNPCGAVIDGRNGKTEVQGVEANPLCPQLPVFDLDVFLREPERSQQLCEALSRCLLEVSALVVRDPRIDQAASDAFLDMMEDYFDQPSELKMPDVHPELAYQVGATPDMVERPRCLAEPELLRVAGAGPDAPTAPTGPDSKWRFFWRVGARPQHTCFAELNAPPVVPGAFGDRWADTMDGWGLGLVRTAETVAQMAARGWGLAPDAFTQRMRQGPHLLAPTGVDLGAEPAPGAVFAGFHTDLNFLTVHGASRYPGLFIWLRDGRRIAVRIPRGCILLQAGTQLEHLTGGAVRAGFHEVVCVPEALEAARRARAAGRPAWRVSSTVFSHLASDSLLEPLDVFATPQARAAYPPILTGEKVQRDLQAISLAAC